MVSKMTNLEDLFKINEDPFNFGKEKKPEKDLPDYLRIYSSLSDEYSSLSDEDERLKQRYRDLEIDLGREREEDDGFGLGREKKGLYEGLGGLGGLGISVGLLYENLKNNKYIIENKNIMELTEYFNFEKEKKKEYTTKNYKIPSILGNMFSSIQTSPSGLNLTLGDSASITADNIGEFALPIVEYIHQTQPDYVVASDRGARLLGLAVFRLHNRLYGRFPTADGTLRFRRFSKSNTERATEKHLQPLVDEILQQVEYEERTGLKRLLPRDVRKKPTVLVLDDWVCSGGTKRLAQQTFDKLGKGRIKTKFGVLVGGGADVSGHNQQTSGFAGVTDWHDDSDIIGVKYGHDNYGSTEIRARPVRGEQARDYRRRMYEGIDKLVEKITEEGKEAVLAKH